MKTAYSYVTLRYVHDVVTGEFVNVGVVLYAPAERYLEARFTASYERLNAVFVKIDHTHYRNLIRYLSNRFVELAAEVRESLNLGPVQGIEELVRRVLPQDDSSLQWSAMGGGFSENPAETVGQLYARLVERYTRSGEVASRNDEDIAKPFRARLQQAAEKLHAKRIVARDYAYDFQYAWENSIWHLFEPVSFDLIDPGSIVEKANRWLGRGVALSDTQERFKIHFLLGEPRQPGTEKAFENARHLLEKIPAQKELVSE
ncbi:MAG TPA: DUF3037 domain-containing protein, partial [Clostridia bacterium]|nr:DUF3037 domain-containing protein [Clostridia bacterium]